MRSIPALAIALVAALAIVCMPSAAAIDCTNLDMLAKGTIYSPADEVVEANVWFSVYPGTGQPTYVIGMNEVSYAGAIMVWGNAGEPSDISGPQRYLSLEIGQTLVIDRLYTDGEAVTSYSLDTTSPNYEVYEPSPIAPPQDLGEQEPTDYTGLVIIGVVACAAIAGLAFVSRKFEWRKFRR